MTVHINIIFSCTSSSVKLSRPLSSHQKHRKAYSISLSSRALRFTILITLYQDYRLQNVGLHCNTAAGMLICCARRSGVDSANQVYRHFNTRVINCVHAKNDELHTDGRKRSTDTQQRPTELGTVNSASITLHTFCILITSLFSY
jgi:hypothetical protein